MRWTVETLNDAVDEELAALPSGLPARMVRLMEMIENVGLENVRELHASTLKAKSGSYEPKQEKE